MGGGCSKGDRVKAKGSRFWKGSRVYKATPNVINNLIEQKVLCATREDFIKRRASGSVFWSVVMAVVHADHTVQKPIIIHWIMLPSYHPRDIFLFY